MDVSLSPPQLKRFISKERKLLFNQLHPFTKFSNFWAHKPHLRLCAFLYAIIIVYEYQRSTQNKSSAFLAL